MSFVDFMILGTMKGGTTTLAKILSTHPDVCFCQVKEPHYFSKTPDWQKYIEDYKALYNPSSNQICGEASVSYTTYPVYNKNIWQDIYSFNPNLKFIYIMRDPVDRILSHYVHNYLRGFTKESFEKNVLSKPTYINISRYFTQIKPYIELFGREQVLLITFEEFIGNKKVALHKVADFLAIDASKFGDIDDIHVNKGFGGFQKNLRVYDKLSQSQFLQSIKPFFPKIITKYADYIIHEVTKVKLDAKPHVSQEMKKIIYDLLILDIREIEKLMGREIIEWNTIKSTEISLK